MLLLFTISITPKKYLHDFFARHTHIVTNSSTNEQAHVTKAGYNCDCNNLVATSPFMDEADCIVVVCPIIYPAFFVPFSNLLHGTSYSFTELRGPPAVG